MCLIKQHTTKICGGAEVYFLDRGEWSASCCGPFTRREVIPKPLWLVMWVDPRGGLEALEKKETYFICLESNRDSSVFQPVS
jgi:hypothetical protein